MTIDKIILGDNQFWGVNHNSQDRGRETGKKFENIEAIRDSMHLALDHGISGVMLSTHPMIYAVTDMMRQDPVLKKNMGIYVNVPYIVKYIRMASEMGITQSLKQTFAGQSWWNSLGFMFKGAYGAVTNNYLSLANRLIDVELNPFHGLQVKAVFLHNALTDLALGYNMVKVIENFSAYIQKRYHVTPAFGTLNLPAMDELLKRTSIEQTVIMAAINKNGFLMNPSRERCEQVIAASKHTILAMATLASGSLKPDEAYEYLFSLPKIQHVVVGVSSKDHAAQTFNLLKRYLP